MKKLIALSASAIAPLLSFAQYGAYSETSPTTTHPGIYILALIVGVLIAIFITRLVFSIPTFLKYQKVQTLLMIKIAKQEKISDQELDTILDIIEERDTPSATNSNTIREIYIKTIKPSPSE